MSNFERGLYGHRIKQMRVSGYGDPKIEALQDLGFVEDRQFNEYSEAQDYAESIVKEWQKVVVVYYQQYSNYGVWS